MAADTDVLMAAHDAMPPQRSTLATARGIVVGLALLSLARAYPRRPERLRLSPSQTPSPTPTLEVVQRPLQPWGGSNLINSARD